MRACQEFQRRQRALRERLPRRSGRAAGAATSLGVAPVRVSLGVIRGMTPVSTDWSARPHTL